MKKKKTPKPKAHFHKILERFNKFRIFSLTVAETFDAWRIIPRLMLIAYAALVLNMYVWYKSIPTYVQEHCDAAVIEILIHNKVEPEEAQKAACSVQNVVGGPTTSQTALVTTIIGLSSLIFGFYTNSGRKWEGGMPTELTPTTQPLPAPPAPAPNGGNPIVITMPTPTPTIPIPT